MRLTINYTFDFTTLNLQFDKSFELPFPPFMGLTISDKGINTTLENDNYTTTSIVYDTNTRYIDVLVTKISHYKWKPESVDETIERHRVAGWRRLDTTNAEELKELLKR